MPFRRAQMYHDYMIYKENWKSQEGAKINKRLNQQDRIRYLK